MARFALCVFLGSSLQARTQGGGFTVWSQGPASLPKVPTFGQVQACTGLMLTLHPLNTALEEDRPSQKHGNGMYPIRAGICHPPPGAGTEGKVEAHSTNYFLQEPQSHTEADLNLSSHKK